MYMYSGMVLIIWSLSASFLIFSFDFVVITKILACRIDKPSKLNASVDFEKPLQKDLGQSPIQSAKILTECS